MHLNRKGVGLVDVLIGILLISVASIATLTYFGYAKGGIQSQGNRRAALERARQRLEQLMAANPTQIAGSNPADGQLYYLSYGPVAAGGPPIWTRSLGPVTENVSVDDLPAQPMVTTAQWVDDPAVGTIGVNDAVELKVKVWFTGRNTDDDYNRVCVKTLRVP